MRQNKKNKGFTLVELLIVVAIIGILAAVLTPQFLNARKVAADKAAEAYAHNVYTAVQAHIAEVGGFGTLNATTGEITEFTGNDLACDAGWPDTANASNYSVPAPAGSSLNISECVVQESGVGIKWTGGTSANGGKTSVGSFNAPSDW